MRITLILLVLNGGSFGYQAYRAMQTAGVEQMLHIAVGSASLVATGTCLYLAAKARGY